MEAASVRPSAACIWRKTVRFRATATVEHDHETPRWKSNPPRSVAVWPPEVAKTRSRPKKLMSSISQKLEMWANAQRDGRPAEYSWRPLFNAAKFG